MTHLLTAKLSTTNSEDMIIINMVITYKRLMVPFKTAWNLMYDSGFVHIIFVNLIFYMQVLNFWFTKFTTYWELFDYWFMWSLIMTFNIENFNNSYCLMANQTNRQGYAFCHRSLLFIIFWGQDTICPRAVFCDSCPILYAIGGYWSDTSV